jgi:DNA polymerase I
MFLYWKQEKAEDTWKLIEDTRQNCEEAISKGAMFFTWMSFSAPYKDDGAEPIRYGSFPLDFDHTLAPSAALDDLKKLLLQCLPNSYGLNPEVLRYFISGSKGFHAEIPAEVFGAQAGDPFLPLIYKKIAADWIKKFNLGTTEKGKPILDLALYNMRKGRMWRLPNVRRENGRYKVPIAFEELRTEPYEQLWEKGDAPRFEFPETPVPDPCAALVELFQKAKAEVHEEQKQRKAKPLTEDQRNKFNQRLPECVRYILRELPKPTEVINFNRLLIDIIQYLQVAGFDSDSAFQVCKPFLEGYTHTDTYQTARDRILHFWMEWEYLNKNPAYEFSCNMIRGLKFPRSAFDCRTCLSDLPEIIMTNKSLPEIAEEAWDALEKSNNPPQIFSNYSGAVRLQHFENSVKLQSFDSGIWLFHLSRSAHWFILKKHGDIWEKLVKYPSRELISYISSSSEVPLPPLSRVVRHPFFTSKGELIVTPGYSEKGRVYYLEASSMQVPKIPEKPSQDHVEKAKGIIEDILHDFPFWKSESSGQNPEYANALSYMLLPFVYDMIIGSKPFHVFEASAPGTGKTLLIDALSYPALGHIIPKTPKPQEEAEWRKLLFSAMLEGAEFLCFDNFKGLLQSAALESVLTGDSIEDRVLGKSQNKTIPIRTIFSGTSNNPSFLTEGIRRMVRIRLDAMMENPLKRHSSDFRHPKLMLYVHQNRGTIVWACLTLIQNWIANGAPQSDKQKPSFEHWAGTLGGILECCGIPGFLENEEDFREKADTDGEGLREFVFAWWEAFKEQVVGVKDLYGIAVAKEIPIWLGFGTSEASQKASLGKTLISLRDRHFRDSEGKLELRVTKVKDKKRAAQYKLIDFKKLPLPLKPREEAPVQTEPPEAVQAPPIPSHVSNTLPDLATLPSVVYLDLEWEGEAPWECQMVTIQVHTAGQTHVVKADDSEAQRGWLKALLEDRDRIKVFQNAKTDFQVLRFYIHGPYVPENVWCTFIAERLLTQSMKECSLSDLSEKYSGKRLDKALQCSFKRGEELTPEQIQYAALDASVLEPIFKQQMEKALEADIMRIFEIEMALVPAVANLELNGIKLDVSAFEDKVKRLEEESGVLLKAIGNGFNPRSHVQIKQKFLEKGIQLKDTTSASLKRLDDPLAKLLVQFKTIDTQIKLFRDNIGKAIRKNTGRIHSTFDQLGAVTGRFTCSKPNLQQVPKNDDWRRLFIAEKGFKLIAADYSQIEMMVLAEMSGDQELISMINAGGDIHRRTAARVFAVPEDQVTKKQRDAAKSVVYGNSYGQGPIGLSESLGVSQEEAQSILDLFNKAFPKAEAKLKELGEQAVTRGYAETMLGRRRVFTDPLKDRSSRNSRVRMGRNTPIQGTANDILKIAMVKVYESLLGRPAWLVHAIHDEIVVEAEENCAEEVSKIIQEWMLKVAGMFLQNVHPKVECKISDHWSK